MLRRTLTAVGSAPSGTSRCTALPHRRGCSAVARRHQCVLRDARCRRIARCAPVGRSRCAFSTTRRCRSSSAGACSSGRTCVSACLRAHLRARVCRRTAQVHECARFTRPGDGAAAVLRVLRHAAPGTHSGTTGATSRSASSSSTSRAISRRHARARPPPTSASRCGKRRIGTTSAQDPCRDHPPRDPSHAALVAVACCTVSVARCIVSVACCIGRRCTLHGLRCTLHRWPPRRRRSTSCTS